MILVPPVSWTDRLPAAIAEGAGSPDAPPLPARFSDPSFGRFIRNLLAWNEAHVGLLRGRFAYDDDSPALSEETAAEMTVAALDLLPGSDLQHARSILAEYIRWIRGGTGGRPRDVGHVEWDRAAGSTQPAWDRLRLQMKWLEHDLEQRARPLSELSEERINRPWRRAGMPERIAGGIVRTVHIPGRPVTGLAAGPQGGVFVQRGEEIAAVAPDGRPIVVYSGGGHLFSPRTFAISADGDLVLVGDDGTLKVRLGAPSAEWISSAPGREEGNPQRTAVTPDGSIVIAHTLKHAIRELRPDGSRRTVAGGGSGRRDGKAEEALFFTPFAVAILIDGTIAVAEKGLSGIRLIGRGEEPRIKLPPEAASIRSPRDVYAKIDQGRALARREKFAEAIVEFDGALEESAIDTNYRNALLERASAREAIQDWKGALGDYFIAGVLGSDDPDVPMGEARVLIALGRPGDAYDALRRAKAIFGRSSSAEVHRDPRYARVFLLAAEAHRVAGNEGLALKEAESAVRARERAATLYGIAWSADDAALYLMRGRLRLVQGEPDRALADFDRAVELAPDLGAAHAGRGDALLAKEEDYPAAGAYREAIRVDEKTLEAHLGLARLYGGSLDDRDRAVRHLYEYLDLGGDEEMGGKLLSDLTATASDRRGSYAEVIRVDPDGKRFRYRIYEDGTRVKIPHPWKAGE